MDEDEMEEFLYWEELLTFGLALGCCSYHREIVDGVGVEVEGRLQQVTRSRGNTQSLQSQHQLNWIVEGLPYSINLYT
jgi:hypothetical protein